MPLAETNRTVHTKTPKKTKLRRGESFQPRTKENDERRTSRTTQPWHRTQQATFGGRPNGESGGILERKGMLILGSLDFRRVG
jgi:hypothetical protein